MNLNTFPKAEHKADRKRPLQRAIVERGPLPEEGVSELYGAVDTACDIGFRHMLLLHAYRQLKENKQFKIALKERELTDRILIDASTVDGPNEALIHEIHTLTDERFDQWEAIEGDPRLKFYASVIEEIDTAGGETKITPDAPHAKKIIELIANAPREEFDIEGERPFVPEGVVKEFKGEVACSIESPQKEPIDVPLSCIVSLAGFRSFEGRGSNESMQKILAYEALDPETAPPLPEVSVVVFEDGVVMGMNTDGSHRIAAAMRRGDKTIKANKVNIYFAKTT